MASVSSSVTAVEYNESHALILDLQSLLNEPQLALHSAVCADGVEIALHTQILRARSPYFNILLRPPWSMPHKPLSLPYPSPVIKDLLEYLITGHVRLEGVAETLALGRAAHLFACDSLVAICATHLRDSLTPALLPRVLALASAQHRPAAPLPEPFAASLRLYVAHAPGGALRCCLRDGGADAEHARRTALLLLADSFHRGEIGASAVAEAALGIVDWTRADALRPALAGCTAGERAAVAELFCAVPPRLFARCVERSGAVPPARVLAKFREDARTAYEATAGADRARDRAGERFVRCESPHPHPSPVAAEQTLRKVRMRGCDAVLVRFDIKSKIGEGAKIVFYRADPRNEEPTEDTVLDSYSGKLPNSLKLPSNEFWFRLEHEQEGDEGNEKKQSEGNWGWLFFVYPTKLKFDRLD